MAPFKKKPKLGGRTNKEFRDEHAGSFEERPEIGGRTNEGFRSESPQFTPKPELGGRTNDQFRGEQEFASKPQIGDGPARVEDVPQPPQPPQAVGGDAGGASLQELEAKIARLEDLATQAEADRNIAQAEMDAVESELQGVKDGLGVEFVKNDPSVALYGQTHDGIFVGDPASNNAQEIYAPGGNSSLERDIYVGDGSMGPKGPKGDPGDDSGPTEPLIVQAPYDAYYFDDRDLPTTFRIRGGFYNDAAAIVDPSAVNMVNGFKWASVAGVFTAVKESGAGGSIDFDDSLTFAANDLIYLYHEATSSGTNVYLEQLTLTTGDHVFADGGDTASEGRLYLPLWIVDWSTDHIAHVLDCRPIAMAMIHRMGN